MEELCGEESEPDFVLAVVPPVRRRLPWPTQPPPVPASVPVEVAVAAAPPVAIVKRPEVPATPSLPRRELPARPPTVPAVAPRVADDAPDAPAIEAAGEKEPGWPDRRWWASTAVSTVVHVVVLTILALIVTVPEHIRAVRPLEIFQPASESDDPVEFMEPEELIAVEIEPPEPVIDPVADEPVLVDVDVAADAEAAAFEVPDVAVGVAEFDAEGLVVRIEGGGGGGAAPGHGAGDGLGGGFGGDVGRRLAAAGAQTGDVQVSLAWDNFNDIDLHVVAPSGEEIFFGHRVSMCRGTLDVDMNATGPQSREPVENVFWPANRAPPGEYRVFVHHYWRHDPNHNETRFTVHVLVDGKKQKFTGSVTFGAPPVAVTAFRKGVGEQAGPVAGTGGDSSDEFDE